MRQSQLFTKTLRNTSEEEVSANAKLLSQGGFIFQELAGVYTFLPLGLRVLRKIEQVVREEMDGIGATELLMPTLTSKSRWETTKRLETMDVLFKASGANKASLERNSTEYIVNSTHEEIVTPTVQAFVGSYKDFPKATYQIQTKFRNEARAKSGILRGREFRMKDLYSFHVSETDLEDYYKVAKGAYTKVFERLGLGPITKYTYASGGDFTDKYSHEFQTITPVGEDTIFICEKCDTAFNKEVYTDNFKCLECGNEKFKEVSACEVGNIFRLGTKYSDAFGFTYKDKDNTNKQIYMGCYGIGTSRLMGVIVEAMHNDNGILWPENVAPFKYHIITLGDREEVLKHSQDLYNKLMSETNGDVLIDDRDISAGEKFKDADLIGVPVRIIVSTKSLEKGGYEMKKRDQEAEIVKFN